METIRKYFTARPVLQKIIFFSLIIVGICGWMNAPVALLFGFLYTTLVGYPFSKPAGHFSGRLLKIAVVGLGFGINMQEVIEVGKNGITLTVISIAVTLFAGFLIGRALHVDKKTSHLVASGTAICGGSAIAAIAPLIKASEKEISVSMGIVFLLNALALFIFPVVGHLLHFTQHQFGLWCAIAIHDTSSVVGAASSYGAEALQTATIVKLARALWIIPVSFATSLFFRNSKGRISIPWFILFYVIAILLSSYLPFVHACSKWIVPVAKNLMVVSLFLIGTGLSIDQVREAGWKPLLLGVLLWVIIAVGVAGVISIK